MGPVHQRRALSLAAVSSRCRSSAWCLRLRAWSKAFAALFLLGPELSDGVEKEPESSSGLRASAPRTNSSAETLSAQVSPTSMGLGGSAPALSIVRFYRGLSSGECYRGGVVDTSVLWDSMYQCSAVRRETANSDPGTASDPSTSTIPLGR
jgi:hypothetical protein